MLKVGDSQESSLLEMLALRVPFAYTPVEGGELVGFSYGHLVFVECPIGTWWSQREGGPRSCTLSQFYSSTEGGTFLSLYVPYTFILVSLSLPLDVK